jgi:gamma-glutamylcysteine synthetase
MHAYNNIGACSVIDKAKFICTVQVKFPLLSQRQFMITIKFSIILSPVSSFSFSSSTANAGYPIMQSNAASVS